MFILPVFRGPNAFENFILQVQMPYILFTSLEDYKLHGDTAQPHLVLTHYPELLESKGLVLVRGDILQPNALDAVSAVSLMSNCHEFYSDRGQKGAFVHAFNHRQAEFDLKRMLDSMGHDTSTLNR
jgi:ATP synthase F1 complex assembly factor 1